VDAQLLHKVSGLLDALEQTTGEPGDLTSTLQHIAQTAKKFFAADACIIFAINPSTNQYIGSLTVVGDLLKRDNLSYEQPRAEGIAPQVLNRGVLLVSDVEAMPEYQSKFTRTEGIRSFAGLALSMRYSRKPLGVLYLDFRQPQQFSPDDQEIFQLFAEQASYILQETWLLRRYQEVAHIGQEINHELATVDILFEKLQQRAAGILDISHTLMLALYQPQTNTLDLYIAEQGHYILRENDPLEGACRYSIETQQPLYIRHRSKEVEHLPFQVAFVKTTGIGPGESLIFVPLMLRGVSLGVLSIQHPQPNVYNQEDLFILQLLANHIALALHNMRLYSSLSQLNETGQLLTQQLESEQTLQAIVDKIHDATKADLVVLYPYEPIAQRFVLPPRIAGTLLDSTFFQSMSSSRLNDIVAPMLRRVKPIFANTNKSITVYTELHSNIHIRQVSFGQREKFHSTAAMPLRVGDESVGLLFVNFRQPQRFDATQKLFIEGLAHYAAIAIKNAQRYGTLSQRRIHELEILQNIDRELSRTLDLKSLLNTLLKLACEQMPADEASVLLYNSRMQALEVLAAIGPHADTRRPRTVPLQETKGITRWVLEHKKPARVDNVHRDPQWRDLYMQAVADTVSELDVPLIDGEEVVGVINFESTREGAFNQQDEDFLLTLAGQAVLAIKNAQAYEREKRLKEEGQVLSQISKEITSQLDPAHVFDLILEKALKLTHSTLGSLHVYDAEMNELLMVAERGVAEDKKGKRQSLDAGIVGNTARTKQLLNVADVSQPPWDKIYVEFIPGTCSELAVPMLAGNELRGVLNIESPHPNNFSEGDERLLKGLADLAVVALQNARAYEREKRLAAEAQVLNEISKEITSQLDPAHVFDLILEKALELTHSNLGNLMLYDPDQNDLWMAAERGVAQDKKGARQGLHQGVVGYAARTKQFLNVDISCSPWNEIYLEFFPGARSELAVPMLAGNELRGVLNVESPFANNFSESDERLLQGLADLAVVALQNAQAYEREKRLAAEAQVLNEISKEITSQLDLARVFDLILEKALELTHSNLCSLMLYNPDQNGLLIVAERGVAEDKEGTRQGLHEGIVGYVATHKQLLNVADVSQSPWDDIYLEFVAGIRSELAVPMLAGNELRGVLNVESFTHNNFSESDERLLQGLADLAVVALQNAQAYEREKRLVVEGRLLNEISKEITSQLDFARVFDLILEKALELTHSTLGSLLLYDPDLNDLWTVAARGVAEDKKGVRLSLQKGIVGYVARNKQLINADLSQPAWKEIYVEFAPGMSSELAVPMLAGNELRGVLYVESPIPNNFSESDERLLQGLADLAVIALQNAQAYEREKRLAAEAQVLNEISKEITGQLDPVHVFDLILEKALDLTHSTIGALMLYDLDLNDLWTATERGLAEDKKHIRVGLDQGIVGYVATQKRLLNVVDVSQPPWNGVYLELFPRTRSELALPMLAGNELRGVLNVESPFANNFSERDERLLQGLADLAVVALQNAERYEKATREAQRFELLYKAGQELGKITELAQLEQAYAAVVQIAQEHSQSLVVIRRYEENTQELVMVRASQPEYSSLFPRQNLDVGVNGQVARKRRTIVIDDTNNPPPGVAAPQLSDPTTRSLLITPIMFKERYYGNLGLSNKDVGHYRGADIRFLEGLAQQLASTIYRLETAQERQESEQRALSAEAMSSIGHMAFELTHRWDNELGLVRSYVNDIGSELEKEGVTNPFIAKKLENIVQVARTVLDLSKDLKQEFVRSGEAIASEPIVPQSRTAYGEPMIMHPSVLLEEVQSFPSLSSTIKLCREIEEDVAGVWAIHSSVADILRNLVANAIEAMPGGGKITLRARNAGRFVAIEVIDTGDGIPEKNLTKIFDLFYSTKGSSGFGLWSARRNALRNHGDLTVKSKVDQGTTFTLLLPRAGGETS